VRSITSAIILVLTLVAAVIIGFGVPLGWVWIGSQLQGGQGASELSFSVVVAMLFGIIITYVILLWIAGIIMVRTGTGGERRPATAQSPWMRGMTDTRQRPTQNAMGGIERLFVSATMIVSAAFWIWFLFFAGSSLPNQ
jgi:hypothetical protein